MICNRQRQKVKKTMAFALTAWRSICFGVIGWGMVCGASGTGVSAPRPLANPTSLLKQAQKCQSFPAVLGEWVVFSVDMALSREASAEDWEAKELDAIYEQIGGYLAKQVTPENVSGWCRRTPLSPALLTLLIQRIGHDFSAIGITTLEKVTVSEGRCRLRFACLRRELQQQVGCLSGVGLDLKRSASFARTDWERLLACGYQMSPPRQRQEILWHLGIVMTSFADMEQPELQGRYPQCARAWKEYRDYLRTLPREDSGLSDLEHPLWRQLLAGPGLKKMQGRGNDEGARLAQAKHLFASTTMTVQRLEKCYVLLCEALECQPTNAETWQLLGKLLLHSKQFEDVDFALLCYLQTLSLRPHEAELLRIVEQLCLRVGLKVNAEATARHRRLLQTPMSGR